MSDHSDPVADLAYIRGIMERSRSALAENGLGYILFGLSSVVCTGFSYLLGFLGWSAWIWTPWVFVFGGTSLVVWRLMAGRHRPANSGQVGRLLAAIWGGITIFGIAACMLLGFLGRIGLGAELCICGLALGLGYFLSGTLIGIAWLRNLSSLWLVGSGGLLFFPDLAAPAVFAGMVLLLEVVPGFLLRARYRKQHGSA